MDSYYKLRQLFYFQSATRFITSWDRYYKVREVLQSAMIIKNCDSTLMRDCMVDFLILYLTTELNGIEMVILSTEKH